jgi:hypothetical protein
MRSGAVVLGLLAGCGFHVPAPPGGDDDAPGGNGCVTFSSQFDTCALALDTDLTLSGTITYNTMTHELRVNGTVMSVAHATPTTTAGEVDAILAHDVHLTSGAGFRAIGPLPFAIVASGSVTLDEGASIDVGVGGAGAGALPLCSSAPHAGGSDAGGGGGGGGGAYGAAGGKGGAGNNNTSVGGAGGNSIAMPAGPAGGCPGAAGGIGGAGGGSAAGGPGGGGLYIVAADSISLGSVAVLTAAGGGGRGGGQAGGSVDGGGGGGGSGGMIFLEASHVRGPASQIAANGGGGGEGGEAGAAGNDGSEGSTLTSRANGGGGRAPNGSDGGRGGSQDQPAGEDVTSPASGAGGGGGGGVGYIRVKSDDVDLGSVSPAPA